MKVKVTKEHVAIIENSSINEGEFNVNMCQFLLPDEFSDLQVTAAFNNIPVPVMNGVCVIPNLNKGTVTLGVYAYREQADAVELMYSPKPTVFYVEEGSYSAEIGVTEKIEISEYERYCHEIREYIDKKTGEVKGALEEISALVGGAE